jgi:hypothetical protein
MIRNVVWFAVACFMMIGLQLFYQPQLNIVHGQENWQVEFADICSKTDDPMALSKEEVASLIERCDKLKARIEKLDESTAKVYLSRLRVCRNLFAFVLDSKSK